MGVTVFWVKYWWGGMGNLQGVNSGPLPFWLELTPCFSLADFVWLKGAQVRVSDLEVVHGVPIGGGFRVLFALSAERL